MSMVIEAKNISFRYGQTRALDNLSFVVEKGDFIGLAGPNGAGKTTLAKIILGLLPPSEGTLSLFGQPQKKFSAFSRIGYLPQKHTSINPLFPALVKEVVLLGLLAGKKSPKTITREDERRVDKTLERLQIETLRDQLLSELSGGEQQRVLLARALVSRPELLIFDEPSTALDPVSRESFFRLIQKINREDQTTILLITHDTGYIGNYANKLLYLDGRLVFFGKIEEFCPEGEIASCFEKSDKHIIWHQHE